MKEKSYTTEEKEREILSQAVFATPTSDLVLRLTEQVIP